MSALDLLTGDAQTFCEKVWASRVHVHRGEPGPLVGLLSLDDVDHLLTETAFRAPAIRLARDGQVLPESSYTRSASLAGKPLTGLVDPRKIFDQLEAGASVVLQGLHRYWPPLADLVAELEVELGHPCQANAYLTPPGSQGFAVHSDSHDVIVFQTEGSKRWEVHEAPLDDPAGEPVRQEVLFEPGVAMYLPTGTPHAARAQDTVSLHVTLGINQLTWRGLVRRAVSPLLDEVDGGHLPAGHLDDPRPVVDGLADRLARLADEVRSLDPEVLAAGERDRFLTSRGPRLRGGLVDRLSLDRIDDTTVLHRRPGHPCVLRPDDPEPGRGRVLLGDRSLTVPGWVLPAIEEVRGRDRITPAHLAPYLDAPSRLVLCRRLVREGLLTVAVP